MFWINFVKWKSCSAATLTENVTSLHRFTQMPTPVKQTLNAKKLPCWIHSSKRTKTFWRKNPQFCSFPHSIPDFWVRQEVDNFDLYSCCCQVFQHIDSCLHCLCFSDVLCNVSMQKANYAPTGRLRALWFFGTVWCIVSWVFSIWQLSPWNWHLYAGEQSPE